MRYDPSLDRVATQRLSLKASSPSHGLQASPLRLRPAGSLFQDESLLQAAGRDSDESLSRISTNSSWFTSQNAATGAASSRWDHAVCRCADPRQRTRCVVSPPLVNEATLGKYATPGADRPVSVWASQSGYRAGSHRFLAISAARGPVQAVGRPPFDGESIRGRLDDGG